VSHQERQAMRISPFSCQSRKTSANTITTISTRSTSFTGRLNLPQFPPSGLRKVNDGSMTALAVTPRGEDRRPHGQQGHFRLAATLALGR
jgi:hypothetical protein